MSSRPHTLFCLSSLRGWSSSKADLNHWSVQDIWRHSDAVSPVCWKLRRRSLVSATRRRPCSAGAHRQVFFSPKLPFLEYLWRRVRSRRCQRCMFWVVCCIVLHSSTRSVCSKFYLQVTSWISSTSCDKKLWYRTAGAYRRPLSWLLFSFHKQKNIVLIPHCSGNG